MVMVTIGNNKQNSSGSSDNISELVVGLLIDEWGNLKSAFGFRNTLNGRLLAGFTHTINSVLKHMSCTFPNLVKEEENRIFENYLNSGFYFNTFRNKIDGRCYRIIIRPIENELFASCWVNKAVIEIIEQLKSSTDIVQDSIELVKQFNVKLNKELDLIKTIKNLITEENLDGKLIFRESGVYSGSLDDPNIMQIYKMALNNICNCNGMKININNLIYEILKKEINNITYYRLKIHKNN